MKTFKQWILGCFGFDTENEATSNTDDVRQPLLSDPTTTYSATSSGESSSKKTTETDQPFVQATSALPTVIPSTTGTMEPATNISSQENPIPVSEQDRSPALPVTTTGTGNPEPVSLPSAMPPRAASPITQPQVQQSLTRPSSPAPVSPVANQSQFSSTMSAVLPATTADALDEDEKKKEIETDTPVEVPRSTTPPNALLSSMTDLENTPRTLAALKSLQPQQQPTVLTTDLTARNSEDNSSDARSSSSRGSSGSSNLSASSLQTAQSILPKISRIQFSNNNGVIAVAIPEEKLVTSGTFSYASAHAIRQQKRDGKNRLGVKVTDFSAQKRALSDALQTLVREEVKLYPEWWLRAKAQAFFTAPAPEGFNEEDAMFHGAFDESRLGVLHPSKTKKQFEASYYEWEKAFIEKITPQTQISQPAAMDDNLVQPIKIRFNSENAPGVQDLITRLIGKLNTRLQTLTSEISASASSTRKQSSGATKKITEQESVTRRIKLLTTVNDALFSSDPNGGLTFEDWSILKVQASNKSGMPYSGALDDKGVAELFESLFVKFQDLTFNQIREELGLVKPASGNRAGSVPIN